MKKLSEEEYWRRVDMLAGLSYITVIIISAVYFIFRIGGFYHIKKENKWIFS